MVFFTFLSVRTGLTPFNNCFSIRPFSALSYTFLDFLACYFLLFRGRAGEAPAFGTGDASVQYPCSAVYLPQMIPVFNVYLTSWWG